MESSDGARKTCSKCGESKNVDEFYTGLRSCKVCRRHQIKNQRAPNLALDKITKSNYYQANKDDISIMRKKNYEENKDIVREKAYEWRHNNKEKASMACHKWKKQNRSYVNEYERNNRKRRMSEDSNYKLKQNLRSRFKKAFSGKGSGSAVKDLGCSIEELKAYLESKFQEGMNWDNYGFYGWHIDHILPLASFDLTDREQLLKACHYTNLQPLWAKDNLKKSDSLPTEVDLG